MFARKVAGAEATIAVYQVLALTAIFANAFDAIVCVYFAMCTFKLKLIYYYGL
jgi:hypothetical protein